jgi:hypothetical protein
LPAAQPVVAIIIELGGGLLLVLGRGSAKPAAADRAAVPYSPSTLLEDNDQGSPDSSVIAKEARHAQDTTR